VKPTIESNGSALPAGPLLSIVGLRTPPRLIALWRLAVGEEGVSHYLRRLPPGGVVIGPEVGAVARAAWFASASAWVAAHDAARGQALYPHIEGVGGRYVLICLAPRHVIVSGSL
jgi:hypothetical protein